MTHAVIGTAGHIDHGKSALVRALTGVDPDRLKEEKDRGITIDLGFAHYEEAGVNIAFVDVPGHERFVRNMLAGVSGIDAVVLVVAADESVMPQTREHFDICRLLGVDTGVVALTKCDLVDADTIELVRLETRELVEGSFLEQAPVLPVSARTGAGLDELRAALRVVAKTPARSAEGPTRLPIDRVFTVKGFGTVVTGTLVSGELNVEKGLEIVPAGLRVKVRGLQVHGRDLKRARAGQRVAVNLAGIEVGDLRRGDTLVAPGGLATTRRFDASLTLLPSARPLKHGARVRCHHGTTEAMARVALSTATDAGAAPTFLSRLEPGTEAFARVSLEEPVALTRGDRFVLRAYSPPVTIAGGEVLDPTPARGRLRSRRGIDRLRRLSAPAGISESAAVMIEEAGGWGVPRAVLARRLGVVPATLDRVIEPLVGERRAVAVGDLIVVPAVLQTLRKQLLQLISSHHTAHPLDTGVSREEARQRLSQRATAAVFGHIVDELVTEGALVATDHLALASHEVALSPDDTRLKERMADLFLAAGLTPPDVSGAAMSTGAAPELAKRMLKLLVREGTLVKVEALLFHRETLERLKNEVRRLKVATTDPVRIDVGMFKGRFDVTRKYAIPLLGYLDQQRVTRRVGNDRLVL